MPCVRPFFCLVQISGLILTALQNRKNVNSFEELSTFNYLVGARIKSVPVKTVVMIYEGALDMNYAEKESLTISDADIAGDNPPPIFGFIYCP